MESLTYFKNQRITPRKYRAVVLLVRGLPPVQAMNVLSKTNKKAAKSLSKVLKSAITNATTTLKVNDDMLQFKLFTIEEGNRLKRFRAASRGIARAFNRRMSHIKIIIRTVDSMPVPEPVNAKVKKNDKAEKQIEAKSVEKKKLETKPKAKVEKVESK